MESDSAAIVMLSSEYPPPMGGVATFTYELSHHMAKRFCAVTLVVPGYRSPSTRQPESAANMVSLAGVPFYSKDIPKPWWYVAYPVCLVSYGLGTWNVARTTPKSPFLAAYWFPDAFIARSVARILHRDYYVTAHGMDILKAIAHHRKRSRLQAILSGARKVFCVSTFTAGQVASVGIPQHKIIVIGNGVNEDHFYSSAEGEAVRQRLGLGSRVLLLTVGRLVNRKGHELVLRALPYVLKESPDTMYLIGGDGPEKGRLVQLSRDLGLHEHVLFLGSIPSEDLRGYYNACDIFVMPNHVGREPWDVEGFGIVFLEAAACGKPVIAGDSGGAPDAVAHGETGFCVPPKDVPALTEMLLRLLRDRDLRIRMGDAGRERVLREFTWKHVAARYAAEMGLAGEPEP